MKINTILIACIAILSLVSCQNRKDDIIAKVDDKYLYRQELISLIPEGTSKLDSQLITNNYINKWIKTQLLLNKAESNLVDEEMDIEREIEEMRASLLIYKYKQKFIKQKLDTVITETQIKDYYDGNPQSFTLADCIVKGTYIKIPKDSQYWDRIKRIYKSNNPDDIKELDGLCSQFATKYDYFNEDWVSFRLINNNIPEPISDVKGFLSRNKFYETSDENFYYVVTVKEYRAKGEIAPLNHVYREISNIILEKRKFTLLKNLENNLYKDAVKHHKFSIFEPKK
ncbi:MAG: hypothetical protein N4A72_14805 [Bacteroidales bacterium]|jgi:hypothetical protein|nr:hypothetical protein [Bacteroidales bacterium]